MSGFHRSLFLTRYLEAYRSSAELRRSARLLVNPRGELVTEADLDQTLPEGPDPVYKTALSAFRDAFRFLFRRDDRHDWIWNALTAEFEKVERDSTFNAETRSGNVVIGAPHMEPANDRPVRNSDIGPPPTPGSRFRLVADLQPGDVITGTEYDGLNRLIGCFVEETIDTRTLTVDVRP